MSKPSDTKPPNVRLRTSSDPVKSFAAYEELKASGGLRSAVIIAAMKDGRYQILGQGMNLDEIAHSLLVAAQTMAAAKDERSKFVFEPHEQPAARGQHTGGLATSPEIKTGADGCLVPPKGENFMSCGECDHPRFYVLLRDHDTALARLACGHCGNELKLISTPPMPTPPSVQ